MKFKNIKLLILDCDGVLTDGKIIYDNNQVETKNFSALDGLGIKLLSFTEIKVAVVTGRKSNLLTKRCNDLGIELVFQGIKNKLKEVTTLLENLNLTWENLAYIGDDWNDYPVIKKAALSATPQNAMPDFKRHVDYVTERSGGNGAVREFIEHILKKQEIYDETIESFINYLENK